ncbi:MAG: endonuclease MutS2 [Bacteroidota bacterium]
MLYPSDIEAKVGFDKIRILLKQSCLSTLGKEMVDKVAFSHNYKHLKKVVGQTEEFKQILESGESFPSSNYIDVKEHLNKGRVEGAFLTEGELFDVKLSLKTILSCRDFLKKREEEYAELSQLITLVNVHSSLVNSIEDKIDDKGKIRDNATPELREIRLSILKEESRLRKVTEGIFKQAKSNGYIPDGSSMTFRDGRMVIPVAAEHKRRIKGFVHDESATGQTVYLEPAEALDINNEIRDLHYREKREVIRILTSLTDLIRGDLDNISKSYRFLSLIDFIRAKAKMAIKLNAVMPLFKNECVVDWTDACHPLLQLTLEEAGKQVVPLTIRLSQNQTILVISGPNAGGKSVCLKSVGLIQYMLQCGMLIPVSEQSTAGIFKDIFIDIGDEQSIEDDLSTYSSHLTNMRNFLQHAGGKSLILIDEFGTGTEPQLGAALAESILTRLLDQKVYGVITTHYANIKQFAKQHDGIENASMRYDVARLEPLYQLEIGRPGSSFALEIAGKIGLPKDVIGDAQNLAGKEHVDFEKLLTQLEKQKQELAKKEKQINAKEKDLRKLINEYSDLKGELTDKKKEILNKAKVEASQLLSDANKTIEKTIRHIKENRAEKKETKKARSKIEVLKKDIKVDPVKTPKEQKVEVIDGVIEVGDAVRIKGQPMIGEVLGMKGKDVEVQVGGLKSNVKLNRLERVSRSLLKKDKDESSSRSTGNMDINEKRAAFSTTLDVRGRRADEILSIVDTYIDNALLFGIGEVRILHGKGDGVLRDLIRQFLRKHSEVESAVDEHVEMGGAGISVVSLK